MKDKPDWLRKSCMYVYMKFFNVNNRAKLKTCLQPGSQSKKLKSKLKS